jgi:hypothetical protein
MMRALHLLEARFMNWTSTAVIRKQKQWTVQVQSSAGESAELAYASEAQARYFAAVDRQPFPFENIPPLIEMAIDAFGPHRLMWGSNYPPVAGRGEGYRNALWWTRERVSFGTEEDKEWLFGKTASTLWKFPA